MDKILITRKVNDERVLNITSFVECFTVVNQWTLTRASSIGFTELTPFALKFHEHA